MIKKLEIGTQCPYLVVPTVGGGLCYNECYDKCRYFSAIKEEEKYIECSFEDDKRSLEEKRREFLIDSGLWFTHGAIL